MPKKIDLKGQRFYKLLVEEETSKRDAKGSIIWLCKCDCGQTTFASTSDLRSGHKKSCGCWQKEKAAATGHANLIDITGEKFGLLTVVAKESSKKTSNGSIKIFWKCKCDCGNCITVEGNALKTGNTRSCGCIKSFGEQKIASILQENKLRFEREKIFPNTNFRFDFFVENTYIIEYDGRQHFQDYSWGSKSHTVEESQKRDNQKNYYCYQNNIPIIRIPYTHYTKLELKDLLLETSNFVVKEFLGDEENQTTKEPSKNLVVSETEGIEQVPEPYKAAAINWDYEIQKCDKCVNFRTQCGGPTRYRPGKCPSGQTYKRDPPDGGYYG